MSDDDMIDPEAIDKMENVLDESEADEGVDLGELSEEE